MNERSRSILMARIQTLIQELDRAKRVVEQIDPDLRYRVRGPFLDLFERYGEDLYRLQHEVKNAQPLKECWYTFQDTRQKCEPLFRECLALMQGSLVRRSGLDNGLCKIADALLYDLSSRINISWGRFTILAGEEFITDMAEIIRVRFPEVSIWNLPVAAHEFGHFVGPELEREISGKHYHPFQDFLAEVGGQDSQAVAFLHEHFADFFATYALGPSYACTCILLRFDPWTAYQDKRAHPSDAKRVHWILEVLNKMDEAEGGVQRSYQGVIGYLRKSWQQSLEVMGQPVPFEERLGKGTIKQLDEWLRELYFRLGDRVSGVWYRAEDWLRAKRLSKQLLEDTPPELKDEHTLADVLNAAWWSRIQLEGRDSARVQQIGARAVDFCCKIGGIGND